MFLAVLGLAGCWPAAGSSPPRTVSEDGRLTRADARLFAGDYDGAEADYRRLAGEGVLGAASHYSTLLAYEGRFTEAVAQAEAEVAARPDSEALARLCRALDWDDQVDAALLAGARAVAVRPVHPLARVFYAEALMDAGHLTEARAQLQRAEQMGGNAYVRSEIDRQWALYDNYLGDTLSQLNHILLAVKEQPRFPERQISLARYELGHNRGQDGSRILDSLAAGNRRNYRVLLGLADSAFLAGDLGRAASLYGQAQRARPGAPEAALGAAELAILTSRDFAWAHDILLEALRSSPDSAAVYQYLTYLDLLVLHRDPAPELAAVFPRVHAAVAAPSQRALARVNLYRTQAGLAPLAPEAALQRAAEAHAYYYLFNLTSSELRGLGIHAESEAAPGFTGDSAIARDRHFGYTGSRSGEVIDHSYGPEGSVERWMGAVSHRFLVLSPQARVAGYGQARVGLVTISVMDIGLGPPSSSPPSVYPSPGQRDVPSAFNGDEIPDPLPSGTRYPVGFPITLQVGDAQRLSVSSARLLDPDGREVPSYTLAPASNASVQANQWALLARSPLRPGGRYTVEVVGQVDGQPLSTNWSFTVVALAAD